jgi:hypothetical protein
MIDILHEKIIRLTFIATFKPCEISEQLAKDERSRSWLNNESCPIVRKDGERGRERSPWKERRVFVPAE